tara:strand:- start:95 stop:604 length:510 start_codon:yes stop_codon:yes gene_type:complete
MIVPYKMVYMVILIFNFNYGHVMKKLNAKSNEISELLDNNKIQSTQNSLPNYDDNGKQKFVTLTANPEHVAFMCNTYNGLEKIQSDKWHGNKYRQTYQLGTAILNAMIHYGYVNHGSIVAFYTIVKPSAKSNQNNIAQWRKNFRVDCGIDCAVKSSPKSFVYDATKLPS